MFIDIAGFAKSDAAEMDYAVLRQQLNQLNAQIEGYDSIWTRDISDSDLNRTRGISDSTRTRLEAFVTRT